MWDVPHPCRGERRNPLRANTVSVCVDYLNRKSLPHRVHAYISQVLVLNQLSNPPTADSRQCRWCERGNFKVSGLSLRSRAINLRAQLQSWPKNLNGIQNLRKRFPGEEKILVSLFNQEFKFFDRIFFSDLLIRLERSENDSTTLRHLERQKCIGHLISAIHRVHSKKVSLK